MHVASREELAGPNILVRYWQPLLLIFATAGLYAPVLAGLVKQWYSDPDYSHGFLVPIFSGYLIYRRRSRLKGIPDDPSSWGLAILLLSFALLFLGSLGAELFLSRVAFLVTILGLLIFLRGFGFVRAIAFPLAFLLLMVPLPAIIYNQIVFPLQLLASRFAAGCLTQSHVMPVLREGNLLVLPNYTLEVVEACSGIRSLMSLITVALAYGYLFESRKLIRGLLALLMIPIAVVSNGMRVMGAALVTYFWTPRAAEGFLHTFSGMVIFVAATAMILLCHSVLKLLFRKPRSAVPVGYED